MRTLITVCIAVVVTAGAVLFAGDTNPPAGPVSGTMKTLDQVEPRIPIESLPYTITQPGSYYLTGNLSTTGHGIILNASDVTIDLMGFTITGSDPAQFIGIYLPSISYENITVRNGTVRSFMRGVQLFTGSQNERGMRILDMRAVDVGVSGLAVGGINAQVINSIAERTDDFAPTGAEGIVCIGGIAQNCTAYNFTYGVILNSAVGENCVARNNEFGIFCIGSVVRGCTAIQNSDTNLFVSSGTDVDNYAPFLPLSSEAPPMPDSINMMDAVDSENTQ